MPLVEPLEPRWLLSATSGEQTVGAGTGVDAAQIVIAHSIADFSTTQGKSGWHYGFYDGDGASPFTPADFELLPAANAHPDGRLVWTQSSWGNAGGVYWTGVWAEGSHAHIDSTEQQWAVRRWVSDVDGLVRLAGRLRKTDTGGDGVVGTIFVDGVSAYSQSITGFNTTGVAFDFTAQVLVGSIIDFALSPRSTNANDSSEFSVAIHHRFIHPADLEDDAYAIAQGELLTRDAGENDVNLYRPIIDTPPSYGLAAIQFDGTLTYQPSPNFHGVESFTYRAAFDPAAPVLLPFHTSWQYLHPTNGVDPADNDPDFHLTWYRNDGSYNGAAFGTAQPAPLGYGVVEYAPIASHIGTPPSGQRYTAYFRTSFVYDGDPAGVQRLVAQLVVDDGAYIYLNGQRAAAVNLPAAGDDLYRTFTPAEGDEGRFHHVDLAPLLVNGVNHLAVSVHNVLPTSSDLGFDLQLVDLTPVSPGRVTVTVADGLRPPVLTDDAFTVLEDGVLDTRGLRSVFDNDGLLDAQGAPVGDAILETMLTTLPAVGEVQWAGDGHFIYTPPLNYNGFATLGYRVRDKDGWSDPASVSIQVTPVDDSVRAADDHYVILAGESLTTSIEQVVVFGTASTWRYLDNGSNQGTAWREPGFNDAGWASGPAPLGYGDGDEATVVSFGPSSTNKYPTTYFRRAFTLTEAQSQAERLIIRLQRDDGAAVFLNGVELIRDNLPNDAAFNTFATAVVDGVNEQNFTTYTLDLTSLARFPAGSPLHAGNNVLAVEIHQVNDTSSDISFDLAMELVLADTGALGNDTTPEDIALTAQLIQGPEHGTLSLHENGAFTYTPEPGFSGIDSFSYRAIDRIVSGDRIIVQENGVWQYHDQGMDLGTAWRSPSYDDSTWATGNASFGYGNTVITPVSFGGDAQNKYPTTYFRHTFEIDDPTEIAALTARISRDDGIVLYLNGVEVVRDNMPASSTYQTYALQAVNAGNFLPFEIDPALLRAGTNVLAAEVHQATANSSDLRFALVLSGRIDDVKGELLIERGHTWRYLADGTDLGSAWRDPAFNDVAWPQGPAELGYGDGDEATVIGVGINPPTAYFRSTFLVNDAHEIQRLVLRSRQDDGAAVYINGIEVVRENLPPDAAFQDSAPFTIGGLAEAFYQPFPIDPGVLVDGINHIAVEVHQDRAASTDLSFDLELAAHRGLDIATVTIDVLPLLPGDLNRDGLANAVDIDLLTEHIRAAESDPAFDLNGDGLVNAADLQHLVEVLLTTRFGDINLDGKVSITDLSTLAANYLTAAGWARGDVNGDGIVTISDLTALAINFGFQRVTAPASGGGSNNVMPTAAIHLVSDSAVILALHPDRDAGAPEAGHWRHIVDLLAEADA